jgi:hypothetical protein
LKEGAIYGEKGSGKTWTAILKASGQKQQLTVVQQWKEWLETVTVGKLPTNQKIEG